MARLQASWRTLDSAAGRLDVFPNLECRWSPGFRAPGAADRLQKALGRWDFRGFTSYLAEAESGAWLMGDEGLAFLRLAADRGLIASLSVLPHQVPHVAELARQVPCLPILLHQMAFLGPRTADTPAGPAHVLAAASCPNIHVKLSGMGNVAGPEDAYPYPRLAWIGQLLLAAFGSDRRLWGSDHPVSGKHMTYWQSLDMVARHGPGDDAARVKMLGPNLARLFGNAPAQTMRDERISNPAKQETLQ